MNNLENNIDVDNVFCEHCGKEFNPKEIGNHILVYDGEYFCSEICAHNGGYSKCDDCGKWSDDGNWFDDCFLCIDCLNNDNNYFLCADCGSWHHFDNGRDITDYGTICLNCYFDGDYFQCACCGDFYESDEETYVAGYGDVCQDCLENGDFFLCEECENYYHCDEECRTNDDESICRNCYEDYENEQGSIREYHASHNNMYHFKCIENENDLKYLGIELEVQNKKDVVSNNMMVEKIVKILDEHGEHDLLFFENDSSIDNGFEIITQPMTLNYIIKNKELFQKILSCLDENGFVSHDASCSCGMHVHISRILFDRDSMARLVYLFEKFSNELIRFSRRSLSQLSRWASFWNIDKKQLSIDYIKENGENHDRYKALNLTNNHTLEARIFKGTLNFNSFMSIIELIDNISDIAINEDDNYVLNIQDFVSIIEYKKNDYLKEYCINRRII